MWHERDNITRARPDLLHRGHMQRVGRVREQVYGDLHFPRYSL